MTKSNESVKTQPGSTLAQFYTPQQICAALQISRTYLYTLANAGRIPARKVGTKIWRFPRREIEAWIKDER